MSLDYLIFMGTTCADLVSAEEMWRQASHDIMVQIMQTTWFLTFARWQHGTCDITITSTKELWQLAAGGENALALLFQGLIQATQFGLSTWIKPDSPQAKKLIGDIFRKESSFFALNQLSILFLLFHYKSPRNLDNPQYMKSNSYPK